MKKGRKKYRHRLGWIACNPRGCKSSRSLRELGEVTRNCQVRRREMNRQWKGTDFQVSLKERKGGKRERKKEVDRTIKRWPDGDLVTVPSSWRYLPFFHLFFFSSASFSDSGEPTGKEYKSLQRLWAVIYDIGFIFRWKKGFRVFSSFQTVYVWGSFSCIHQNIIARNIAYIDHYRDSWYTARTRRFIAKHTSHVNFIIYGFFL